MRAAVTLVVPPSSARTARTDLENSSALAGTWAGAWVVAGSRNNGSRNNGSRNNGSRNNGRMSSRSVSVSTWIRTCTPAAAAFALPATIARADSTPDNLPAPLPRRGSATAAEPSRAARSTTCRTTPSTRSGGVGAGVTTTAANTIRSVVARAAFTAFTGSTMICPAVYDPLGGGFRPSRPTPALKLPDIEPETLNGTTTTSASPLNRSLTTASTAGRGPFVAVVGDASRAAITGARYG